MFRFHLHLFVIMNFISDVYLNKSRIWNFKNSETVIVSYLKLQDTAALQNFIDNEKIKSVLKAYLTEKQEFFRLINSNIIKKKQKLVELKKINSYVLHSVTQNSSYMQFMFQITNVILIFLIVRQNSIVVVSTLNFITRLIRAVLWTFSSSMLSLTEQFQLNSEDIHCEFYLLKHVWKHNQESHKEKKHFQNKSVIQIVYRNQSADIMKNLILIIIKTEAS